MNKRELVELIFDFLQNNNVYAASDTVDYDVIHDLGLELVRNATEAQREYDNLT